MFKMKLNILIIFTICILLIPFYKIYAENTKNILILNSYHSGLKWTDDQVEGIISKIENIDDKSNVSIEYMDWKQYPDIKNIENVYNYLYHKYASKKIDLVITTDDAALDFGVKYRDKLFSNAPIVFSGVNIEGVEAIVGSNTNVSGVIENVNAENTAKLALKIKPDLKNMFLIFEDSESGLSTFILTKRIIEKNFNINVYGITSDSLYNIKDTVKKINNDSIIVIISYYFNIEKNNISISDFSKYISENSNVPVLHYYEDALNCGIIGGSFLSGKLQGERAGEIAVRVLNGENINSIPIIHDGTIISEVDYNQLKKFNIDKDIFKNSNINIINEPFSFIKTYKNLVIITISFIALLMALILILIVYNNKINNLRKKILSDNEELCMLNEEMTASEEELKQQNYNLIEIQEKLAYNEERYKLTVKASNDGSWYYDERINKLHLSERFYEVLGYTKGEDYIDDKLEKLIHMDDRNKVKEVFMVHINDKTENFEADCRILTKNNSYKWIHIRGKALFNINGKYYMMAGSLMDIDELRKYEDKLKQSAYFDVLTQLPNRLSFNETVDNEINSNINLGFEYKFAILFFDIDNFKVINDTLGHTIGDRFLIEFSKRVSVLINDRCVLYRLGGDEFVYYIKNFKSIDEIEDCAKDIMKFLNKPFVIEKNVINTTASIGIAIYPKDGKDIDVLLKNADIAMYKVKSKGKNNYMFFNNIINEELLYKVRIENNLRYAIKNNEFKLYYQPLINACDSKICGFEALIRWFNEDNIIAPDKFIKIAEETGFIVPIGYYVLNNACRFIKEFNYRNNTNCYVSVNVSVVQLLQNNFVQKVIDIINKLDISVSNLQIEITESVLMDILSPAIITLKELSDRGIKISIDDFGTGYSSFAYLKKLPIKEIKIDKLFIDDILDNKNLCIADSIINLGHKLNLCVVAEGVELQRQVEYLKNNFCDKLQGYYFSKPISEDEVQNYFNKFI